MKDVQKVKDIVEYNYFRDRNLYRIAVLTSLVVSAIIFFLILTPYGTSLYESSGLSGLVSYFLYHIENQTMYAAFYTGLIGGLFFLTVPLEAIFLGLVGESVIGSILGIILGITLSYIVNYSVGFSLSGVTRRLVGPQKFFSLKAALNKYGAILILLFNLIPMVGQSFTALLGVIKYNKTRLALYTLTAQFIKYPLLALLVL